MAITGAIANFSTGTYTVARTAAGTVVDGIDTPGASSTLDIVASVQPLGGRELADLQSLPEGERMSDMRVVYTTTELKGRTGSTGVDRIAIEDGSWEVVRVEPWKAWGTMHYRVLVSRVSP